MDFSVQQQWIDQSPQRYADLQQCSCTECNDGRMAAAKCTATFSALLAMTPFSLSLLLQARFFLALCLFHSCFMFVPCLFLSCFMSVSCLLLLQVRSMSFWCLLRAPLWRVLHTSRTFLPIHAFLCGRRCVLATVRLVLVPPSPLCFLPCATLSLPAWDSCHGVMSDNLFIAVSLDFLLCR